MTEYDELIAEKKLIKAKHCLELTQHQSKIKEFQRNKNQENQKKYFKLLMLLDILFTIAIICNFGAVVLTNAMVVKNNTNVQFLEANPSQSEVFKKTDTNIYFLIFLSQALRLSFIIIIYAIYRTRIYNEISLYGVISIAILAFIILGWDFINDFGYYIGLVIS